MKKAIFSLVVVALFLVTMASASSLGKFSLRSTESDIKLNINSNCGHGGGYIMLWDGDTKITYSLKQVDSDCNGELTYNVKVTAVNYNTREIIITSYINIPAEYDGDSFVIEDIDVAVKNLRG